MCVVHKEAHLLRQIQDSYEDIARLTAKIRGCEKELETLRGVSFGQAQQAV